MASTSPPCTISGGGDIVGPGVRISIYIQTIQAIFKIASPDDSNDSAILAASTTFSLIVSAFAGDISYALHLEVSQFVALLMFVSFFLVGGHRYTRILCLLVSLMSICYNLWLWSVIKWELPREECGDQMKIYIFFVPANPIGWYRIFSLVFFCCSLLSCVKLLFTKIKNIVKKKPDKEDVMASELEENIKEENNGTIGTKGDVASYVMFIGCIGFIVFLSFLAALIGTIELSVQRNPISGIWDWGFGQVFALILAVLDAFHTIYKFKEVMIEKVNK